MTAIFDQYADPDDKDSIEGEKLQEFFTDLGRDLAGVGPLALAWAYKCENFAAVSRSEFNRYYTRQGSIYKLWPNDDLAGAYTSYPFGNGILLTQPPFPFVCAELILSRR